ncbi:hypothetical protein QJS83_07210 [Bdellovibrio sp. 22V]|uniref:hypothetical protein n=1 Tax=Bdellovibrio sp. 22V TaxID=3044166 RepID=UPI0025438072|nr:hypothetical protein [Bdellovibrio sp. 22V]WII73661.1 hypothetical protein QJS83_07210 [Bdellovibrio sp. 22V]
MIKTFLLITLFSLPTLADTCLDSDKGLLPEQAGKVVYSLGGENCLGEACYSQMVKEFDRCLDSQRVLEFACENGTVLEKEITCSGEQTCRKGTCVKK